MNVIQNSLITIFLMLIILNSNAATTITVNWAIDESPASNNHTCTYDQGGLFSSSDADKCTFRRALRQAGAMIDDGACQGCAPITINFNGLNGTNGDGDDGHFNNGQWVLPMTSTGQTSFFGLKPQSITDVVGPISIIGPDVDVLNNEMPKVMIDSGVTLDLQIAGITIKNLGFKGGMSIHWKEENGVFENNTWGLSADGQSIEFGDLVGNTDNLAGSHAILTTNKADNMLVSSNVLSGAATFAVEINSSTMGVQILDNLIGTRIDGTVPAVPADLQCRSFTNINPVEPAIQPSEWFGGAGISAAGTGLMILRNTIAGLQSIHSTFATPPEALTVFGAMHTIENNIIGQDINGQSVGVCGQGIKMSTRTDVITPVNNGHMVIDNVIDSSRNGFDNTIGAILWSDTSSGAFLDGGNTIRGNLVINGPEKYFEIGPMLTTPIKLFEPGEITSVNGVNVIGRSDTSDVMGDPSPCPNCIIDFYLDDGDDNEEGLEHLGSSVANGNGDFTFTLASPLADGTGIRTTSTTTADNVIPHTWSGQTSEMSNQAYGLISDIIFKDDFE